MSKRKHNHLVGRLFPGPLDIVGDIHGEIDALDDLLGHLGYADNGLHPDGRRLVFVGDLVDRGPNSPAVLRRVRELVDAERAQCILGNHELNLLREDRKSDNLWWTAPDKPSKHPAVHVTPDEKAELIPFLNSLPLALENDDLRVVHACWHEDSINTLRALDISAGAAQLYEHYTKQSTDEMLDNRFMSFVKREWMQHGPRLQDPDWDAVFMPAKAELDTRTQMGNPIAVLTSGAERPTGAPFWAGGKWRMTERGTWWNDYDHHVPVIVGHYWRRFGNAAIHLCDKYGPDLFAGTQPHHWLGKHDNVYCVDFSVGARAGQRVEGLPTNVCKLAAVRMPEGQLMHDEGASALLV